MRKIVLGILFALVIISLGCTRQQIVPEPPEENKLSELPVTAPKEVPASPIEISLENFAK